MDRTQKSLKLLAVFAYAMLALGLILGTSYATLIMVALLIVAVVLSKQAQDDSALLPVIGAQVLYFGVKLLDVVFSVLASIVTRCDDWFGSEPTTEDIMNSWVSGSSSSSDGIETMNEVFDFIILLVSIAAIVFAVIAVINLLSGKDFGKSLVGKIAAPFVCNKEVYYCANCGSAVKGDFCGKCGTKKE